MGCVVTWRARWRRTCWPTMCSDVRGVDTPTVLFTARRCGPRSFISRGQHEPFRTDDRCGMARAIPLHRPAATDKRGCVGEELSTFLKRVLLECLTLGDWGILFPRVIRVTYKESVFRCRLSGYFSPPSLILHSTEQSNTNIRVSNRRGLAWQVVLEWILIIEAHLTQLDQRLGVRLRLSMRRLRIQIRYEVGSARPRRCIRH